MSSQPSLPRLLPRLPRGPNADPPNIAHGKRKRGGFHRACNNCRKRRTKCDGDRPICTACRRSSLTCEYELPAGVTSKQADQQRLLHLGREKEDLQSVVNLLRAGSESDSAVALSKIRQASTVDDAVNTLAGAQALLTAATISNATCSSAARACMTGDMEFARPAQPLLTSPAHHPDYIFEKQFAYAYDQHVAKDAIVNCSSQTLDVAQWTNVSDDNQLLSHLLTMFWTWDYVAGRLVYRPLFEEDLTRNGARSPDVEQTSFCTPFLVNSLLALSCVYSMEREVFLDPDNIMTRGQQFLREAEKCYEVEKGRPSITLMQGEYALFCYEGSIGSGKKAMDHMFRSFEIFRVLNNDAFLNLESSYCDGKRRQRENEAKSWAFWGLYAAEWRSSQALGLKKQVLKPLIGKLWRNDDFPLRDPTHVGYWWSPYPLSLKDQRSLSVEVREADVLLSEIVEEAINLLATSNNAAASVGAEPHRAYELYNALVGWKFSLPPQLRPEDAVLPCIILMHVSVEVMLTALLSPLCHLSKAEFGPFDPKERCYSHAVNLQSTVWAFRGISILPPQYYLCYAVSMAAFVLIGERDMSPAQVETLIKACQCLHEMRRVLPIAEDCLFAIQGAYRWSTMRLPFVLERFLLRNGHARKDSVMHRVVVPIVASAVSRRGRAAAPGIVFQDLLDDIGDLEID